MITNMKKKSKVCLLIFTFLIVCLTAFGICEFFKIYAHADSQNVNNSLEAEDPYVLVKDKDYKIKPYNHDGKSKDGYNSYYMIHIINPDSISTWDLDNDKPRQWKLECDNINLFETEGLDTQVKGTLTVEYVVQYYWDDLYQTYLIVTFTEKNTGKTYDYNFYVQLTDGTGKAYTGNDKPIVLARKDTLYDPQQITSIALCLEDETPEVVDYSSNIDKYYSKGYSEGFQSNKTLDFCLTSESLIDFWLNKIDSDEFWSAFLIKRKQKLEDLLYKNLENARNLFTEDAYYCFYQYLCPENCPDPDCYETVASFCQYLKINKDNILNEGKFSLNNWFAQLSELEEQYHFTSKIKNLEDFKKRIGSANSFVDLCNIVYKDEYLNFLFYRTWKSQSCETAYAEERIMEAIQFYKEHAEKNKDFPYTFDIDQYVYEACQLNENVAKTWGSVFENWESLNKTVDYVNFDSKKISLSDNQGGLCIAVHGFALNDDGTIPKEYADRLLKAAEVWELNKDFPNVYIAIMGGGTAKNNSKVTEASVGREYLLSICDIDNDHIICEDRSLNTIQNVEFLMDKLSNDTAYSDIKWQQLCICTSDYHIRRCGALWESAINASRYAPEIYNNDVFMDIPTISNIASKTNKPEETIECQGLWVERLMLMPNFSGNYKVGSPSAIDKIYVEQGNRFYALKNEEFKPQVLGKFIKENKINEKSYDLYEYDVTSHCSVDCDTSKVGFTTCTITFNYGNDSAHLLKCVLFVEVVDEIPSDYTDDFNFHNNAPCYPTENIPCA